MAVLTSYTTGDDAYYSSYVAPYYNLAQTFKLNQPAQLSSIKLLIFRTGTPGSCSIAVRNTSGGEPNEVEATVGFNANSLTADTAGEWKDIPMPLSLAAGTYAVQLNGQNDAGNTLHWRVDSSSATYTNGTAYHADSPILGEWAIFTNQDFLFEVNGAWTGPAPFSPPPGGPTKKRAIAVARDRFFYEDV